MNSTSPTTPQTSAGGFTFDNSFARELDGVYVPWQAVTVPAPRLLKLNLDLAQELGLDGTALNGELGTEIFSGNLLPLGATPLAQAYAGHQFGGYSPRLGDGRALLLGEVIDIHGQRRDIAFKGSGRTPFSRGGDGKAAIGPVLREYLIGEAMHALGLPTTRALAAVATGENILRDNGPLPGAVLTRVAASHIRVGTFQLVAAREDLAMLRRLADYVIQRHYPALKEQANPYLALFGAVAERQAALIAGWMTVGFIHGVMNTDNMTLSGETIDYGPCAFMDRFDAATVYSSIDENGRYAYGNQPMIANWNLARLAEAMLPLFAENTDTAVSLAMDVLNAFPQHYQTHWLNRMRAKLGISGSQPDDMTLANDFLGSMNGQAVDYTQAFRCLGEVAKNSGNAESHDQALTALHALYVDSTVFNAWLSRWQQRVQDDRTATERAAAMHAVNPLYIPRNHKVEEALTAASEHRDMQPFEQLLKIIQQPFVEQAGGQDYVLPLSMAASANYKTFCGT
ncbi:MAG: YdiU family protein [Rugosibacter sp.]